MTSESVAAGSEERSVGAPAPSFSRRAMVVEYRGLSESAVVPAFCRRSPCRFYLAAGRCAIRPRFWTAVAKRSGHTAFGSLERIKKKCSQRGARIFGLGRVACRAIVQRTTADADHRPSPKERLSTLAQRATVDPRNGAVTEAKRSPKPKRPLQPWILTLPRGYHFS